MSFEELCVQVCYDLGLATPNLEMHGTRRLDLAFVFDETEVLVTYEPESYPDAIQLSANVIVLPSNMALAGTRWLMDCNSVMHWQFPAVFGLDKKTGAVVLQHYCSLQEATSDSLVEQITTLATVVEASRTSFHLGMQNHELIGSLNFLGGVNLGGWRPR